MSTPTELGLPRWHAIVESGDSAGLADLVAEDAVFHSPAVFKPQEGKPLVVAYLTAALKVLGEDFSYVDEWPRENDAILEFTSTLGDLQVFGIDRITWDDHGRITEFTVMIRPLKSLNALVERMGEELTALAEAAKPE
ncbi:MULTISPECIES: nuclear transport factor 2 family protein [unclassified Nocardioides]|uniref:nuclear transport factor 2 family protein n=1 Tax=unclassified Nocardioides TaxID=2615069 RepID=UPI0007012A6F|nr:MULTISPECIES: nuclear transport factor 2 family protein [unclassified Nocardioides]KQY64635.1 polyketide cyclase [Nocardioides sp. Root140]KQZ67385.1 polyketide cyclase [Nocardioides sp. Root151]KRF12539.1 polyketide cyclase [Nocardioides sp. Soil796]